MRICVVGTGYVGLVAGAGFAEFGSDVMCADVDESKVSRLNDGHIPIYEPGLAPLVQRNVEAQRLRFTTNVQDAVRNVDAVFIAVGTPPQKDGSADLTQIWNVARTVAEHATGFTVVVTKSTVPVGTADRIEEILTEHRKADEFGVVSNPEFLKEGDAVRDFLKPERVVIGTSSEKARHVMRYLYGPFVRTIDRILMMDARSAELTKYACNAMLATRISFMNEMARLCDRVEADVQKVRQGMAWDERIGRHFLFPGVGYGGSCFPKDVKAIIKTAHSFGVPLNILDAVEEVNEGQKGLLAERIHQYFEGDLQGKTIALWGLSFKPQTDDVREAPALEIAKRLLKSGAKLQLHDPVAQQNFSELLPPSQTVAYFDSNYDAAEGADALALVTEWHAFRRPDFSRLKTLMARPHLFDGRNIWDPEIVRELGFTYKGIGRR